MIPQIDSEIGITVHTTKFPGIAGGSIRDTVDDFEVSEVISEKALESIREDSGYAVYVLRKRKIDTAHAIGAVLKKTRVRLKALGLKDAHAVTSQYVCSSSRTRALEHFATERFTLERIGFVKKPLSKKDMVANRFRIRVSGGKDALRGFAEHDRVLNFYGYQRFGSKRPVTHLVGKAILQADFERAVRLILSYTSEYDSKENSELREKLSDSANYKTCLRQLPRQMDIERTVLTELVSHNDALKALRAVPVSMRRFYVQAYQSYLFNCTLCSAFRDGEDLFGPQEGDVCFDSEGQIGKYAGKPGQRLAAPFVGYSYYSRTRFHRHVKKILESEKISPKDFVSSMMQEAGNAGGFRQSAINCTDYSVEDDTVGFTLSRGSFATILLREIIKPRDPIMAGF